MATYKRDNQVFKKEAEDRRKESTSAKNVARTLLGQGLAFGFGDEIEASIKNLFSEKDYNEIITEVRGEIDQFRTDNPALAYGTEIGGAILPSIAATVLTGGGAAPAVAANTARMAQGMRGLNALKTGANTAAKPITKLGQAINKNPVKASAAYGVGTTESSPEATILESLKDRATGGAIGGAIGGAANKAIGAVMPKISTSARELMDEGVNLTPAQALSQKSIVGSGLKTSEDALTAVPFVGTKGAVEKSVQSFNNSVANNIAKRGGFKISKESIEAGNSAINKELRDKIGNKINTAVDDLVLENSIDFITRTTKTIQNSGLTKSEQKKVVARLSNVLRRNEGNYTGKVLQDADRQMRKILSSYGRNASPDDTAIAKVFSTIYDDFASSLTGTTKNAVKDYQKFRSLYKDYMIFNNASLKSVGNETFSPNQLLNSIKQMDQTAGKYATAQGTGSNLQQMAANAQKIMGGTVGDSGTATRNLLTDLTVGGGIGTAAYANPLSLLGPTVYNQIAKNPYLSRGTSELINATTIGTKAASPYFGGTDTGQNMGKNYIANPLIGLTNFGLGTSIPSIR